VPSDTCPDGPDHAAATAAPAAALQPDNTVNAMTVNAVLWIRSLSTPGSGIRDKKIKIRIRVEHPGSYFRELINNFCGKNN
jgi:hypothetical protein